MAESDDLARLGFVVKDDGLRKGEKALDKFARKGEKTEQRVERASVRISNSFMSLSKSINVAGAAMAALGAGVSFGVIVQTTKEFNKEISSLSAITGAVGKDLEFFKEQSLAIGSATTLSASQAAQAFKLIASAKPDLLGNAQALAEVTKEAVALSEATGIALPEAANVLGTSLNQFNLSAKNSSETINILAASSKLGTAQVFQVAESLKNAGSAANSLGIDLAETVAGVQALAKAGITGAEGGTALRQIMLKLENTANKNLMPSVVGLAGALENLQEMNLSNTELIKMFGQEAFSAATAILNQRDTLEQLNKTLRGTQTAYEQASIQQDNLDGDLLKLGSTVEGLTIDIGQGLDPALRGLAQSTNSLLSNTDALADSGEALVSVIGAYAAISGGKALAGTVASIAADEAAIKEKIKLTTATVAQTESEIALLATQRASYVESIKRIKSESIRTTLRSQLTKATLAQAAAESRLTVATSAQTSAATAATFATRALGTATSFLLGPWGLLLTAVGTAATVFAMSKDESDKLNKSLETQEEKINDLVTVYSKLSNSKLGAMAVEVRREIISLNAELKKIESQSAGGRGVSTMLQNKSDEIKAQIAELNSVQTAIQKVFAGGMPDNFKPIEDLAINKTAIADVASNVGDLAFAYEQYASAMINSKSAYETATEGQRKLTEEYNQWISSVRDSADPTKKLIEEIEKVKKALELGDLDTDTANTRIKQLQDQIESIKPLFSGITNGATDALRSVQGLSEQGSKEYRKLGIAIQAVSAAQAIYNVLNQGGGDPYTAFPRMLAMAAAVASLGFSVAGSFGGGTDDSAQKAQEAQGLNEWNEKAASISDSIEMIESATDDLVGINTDMLKALKSLRINIGGAATIIARDVETPTASVSLKNPSSLDLINEGIPNFISDILGDSFGGIAQIASIVPNVISGITNKIFGGSSKVKDEGIRIIGGSIEDLIDSTTVEAFQRIKYKKWAFGSSKTKTKTKDISDQVGSQFELVFQSLADSVFSGATALGLNEKSVENSINKFVIDTMQISLKGLSADEQVKAIEDVFSQVFNNLTRSVIPWIDEFQQAGEDIGTTLSRVATEVAIADLLVNQLGVTLSDKLSNPKLYATIADNITTLVGGIEELSSKTSSFIDNFATDEQKISILGDSLTNTLNEVGLELPTTASGFWDLMGTLDGTTDAGQRQIATLLNIQDAANDYVKLLDKQNSKFIDLADSLAKATMSMYDMDNAAKEISLNSALESARMGDFEKALNLDTGSLSPDASEFSSLAEYELAKASTANKMLELAGLAEGQTDVQSEQLNVLREINQAIRSNYNSTNQMQNNNDMINQMKSQSDDISRLKDASVSNAKTNAKMAKDINRMVNTGIPTYED